jgi:hypothetical protein
LVFAAASAVGLAEAGAGAAEALPMALGCSELLPQPAPRNNTAVQAAAAIRRRMESPRSYLPMPAHIWMSA